MRADIRRGGRGLRWGLATALLAAVALLGVACGDDEETPAKTTTSGTTATSTATSTATLPTSTAKAAATATSTGTAAASTAAAGGTTLAVATVGSHGQVLTDGAGKTLYTFARDTAGSGTSACEGACASTWPALTIASGSPTKPAAASGEVAVLTRTDGSMQVTYKGMPLYRYAPDTAPGEAKGEGVSNVWFVAKP